MLSGAVLKQFLNYLKVKFVKARVWNEEKANYF